MGGEHRGAFSSSGPAPLIAAPAGSNTVSALADPIKVLVARLDLDTYKATIKGLTQFGDRRQGTDRNSAALTTLGAIARLSGATF